MKIECMKHGKLEAYVTLINRAKADRPKHRIFTSEQIELMTFKDPHYDEKGHFLASVENELVGEAMGIVYPGDVTDAGLWGELRLSVLPEYRRKGIGKKLMETVCEYLRNRNVKEVYTEVPADCRGSRNFYEKLGFSISKKLFALAFNLQMELPSAFPPVGYIVRSPEFPDEKTEFLQVWNKSNSANTESSPMLTTEAFEIFLSFPGVKSGYFVVEREDVNRIVGVLSGYIDPNYNENNRVKEGTIEIVGVLHEERRKGIGSSLIVKGLEWMKAEGMDTVFSYVYSGNKDSLKVFESLGFRTVSEDLTYKLRI